MIILTSNILAVLALLLTGVLDLWLLAASLRFAVGQLPSASSSRLFIVLRELTDPPPRYVGQRLSRWRQRPTPFWLAWVIVIAGGLVLRQLLQSSMLDTR